MFGDKLFRRNFRAYVARFYFCQFHLMFPNLRKLSAEASRASSLVRGSHPKIVFALLLLAFLFMPNSGTSAFAFGLNNAAIRTNQSGITFEEAFFAMEGT